MNQDQTENIPISETRNKKKQKKKDNKNFPYKKGGGFRTNLNIQLE